ncbi:LuxR C-terminal-related transcriptional regulator [Nocardioides sp. GXZ039]|uniref:LuxR C-terminal-related transcriptional regulator n=1 Tax=Nocardioides sp. GXZ039 TaxID=3136018 RepID=UPI0030F38EC1
MVDQHRNFRLLRRLAHEIRYASDIGPVLGSALDCALEMTGASIGALSYADMNTQRYILAAHRGLSESYVKGITTWSLHEGLAGQSFGLREPLTVTDLSASREVSRSVVQEERLRGYVCVPLLRGQRRLGIVEVFDREPRAFSVEEVESLELVAAFVSSVVESLVMIDEVRFLREERAQVLRQWTTQALTAADTQRRELARRLEQEADTLGSAENAEAADRLRRLARELLDSEMQWVDMVPLVREAIAERWSTHSGKQVDLVLGQWPPALPLELTTRLYLLMHGLVQAAATAAETEVVLHLGGEGDEFWIEVCDDRPRSPRGDTLAELPADVGAQARGLEGVLRPAVDDAGRRGVRVLLSLGLTRPTVQSLTDRERRVLEGLTLGTPNRELAAELGISPKTLQNHLTSIYRKLGVTSRAQAVRML